MAVGIFVEAFEPAGVIACREYDPGPPHAGEVRVAVRAAGLSYADVLIMRGAYQARPDLPFIGGTECAGVVEAVGVDVAGVDIGDRVAVHGWGGMFADIANMPADRLQPIPDGLSFEHAAVLPASYMTAWYALVDRGALASGETLLVLGAGGATGLAAVQIGKHLGARVIGSASSEAKRAMVLAGGADAVVDARAQDWRDGIKAANGGRPIDVVFDPVGGDASEPAFRSLAWRGRHLVIGFPGGIAALRTNLPLLKGASLVGVDVRQFGMYEPDRAAAMRTKIFDLAGRGVLRPVIAARYSLHDFGSAIEAVNADAGAGRVIFTPPTRLVVPR